MSLRRMMLSLVLLLPLALVASRVPKLYHHGSIVSCLLPCRITLARASFLTNAGQLFLSFFVVVVVVAADGHHHCPMMITTANSTSRRNGRVAASTNKGTTASTTGNDRHLGRPAATWTVPPPRGRPHLRRHRGTKGRFKPLPLLIECLFQKILPNRRRSLPMDRPTTVNP
jgi:hypothetical protein